MRTRNRAGALLFVVVMTTVMAVGGPLIAQGRDPGLVVAVATLASWALLSLAQRVNPHSKGWWVAPREWLLDAAHSLFSTTLATELVKLALLGAILAAAGAIEGWGLNVWPDAAPLWLQVPLAMVVSEFFLYWTHRFSHEHPLLWPIHAVHHSAERMHLLTSGRIHPLQSFYSWTLLVTPPLLLGANAEVLGIAALWTSVFALFQHANIAVDLGPLSWVLSSPDLHRWHHSKDRAASCSNYGNNLIVWDLIFGTRQSPTESTPELGLDAWDLGINYWRHLSAPFRLEKLRRQ